jgi:hypothetical protein
MVLTADTLIDGHLSVFLIKAEIRKHLMKISRTILRGSKFYLKSTISDIRFSNLHELGLMLDISNLNQSDLATLMFYFLK